MVDARLPPRPDHHRENPRRRALVRPAQLQGSLAIELAAGKTFEESIGEFAGDDPLAPQREHPLQHIAQRDHRTDRQRPEHRVGVQNEPQDARAVDSRLCVAEPIARPVMSLRCVRVEPSASRRRRRVAGIASFCRSIQACGRRLAPATAQPSQTTPRSRTEHQNERSAGHHLASSRLATGASYPTAGFFLAGIRRPDAHRSRGDRPAELCSIHSDRLGVDPGHQAAQPLADLLDRMLAFDRLVALNIGRLARFSRIHSRANWPDRISARIFFISARVCSLTIRGPRV